MSFGGGAAAAVVGAFSEKAGRVTQDATVVASAGATNGNRLRPCNPSGWDSPLKSSNVGMMSMSCTFSSTTTPDGMAPGHRMTSGTCVSSL